MKIVVNKARTRRDMDTLGPNQIDILFLLVIQHLGDVQAIADGIEAAYED